MFAAIADSPPESYHDTPAWFIQAGLLAIGVSVAALILVPLTLARNLPRWRLCAGLIWPIGAAAIPYIQGLELPLWFMFLLVHIGLGVVLALFPRLESA